MNNLLNIINVRLLVVAILLILTNVLLVDSTDAMAAIAVVQFFILLSILLIYGNRQFLLLLLLFTATGFDVPAFVNSDIDTFKSVSNLPYIGLTGFILLIVLSLLICIGTGGLKYKILNENLKLLLKFTIYVMVSGLLMSFVCLLFNDNYIPTSAFIQFFKHDFSKYFTISLVIVLYIIQISTDGVFYLLLKQYTFTILVSIILVAFISVLLGKSGSYGKHDIILMPLSYFYSITIILFLTYYDFRQHKLLLIFMSGIVLYLHFFHSNALSGKSWLLFILIAVLFIVRILKKGVGFKTIVIVFLVIAASFYALNVFSSKQQDEENLLIRKVTEALSVVLISQTNYYENMPESPRARIDEFLNTVEEFKQKPYYALMGKGFGGSIKDHKQVFGRFQSSAFSDEEYINQSFVFLHETINVVLLKFGLIGLAFIALLVGKVLKSGFTNPWLFIGVVWLFLFFGYTFSLGVFGCAALVLGLYEENKDMDTLFITLNKSS